ncbi:MAG: hypothetical protein AB1659_04285 [Thermodesulfobacteriota bacterium]
MRKGFSACLTTLFILIGYFTADASWLIEEAKRHASAHGRIECIECHPNILQKKIHPDPADVDLSPYAFSSIDPCEGCHPSVYSDLAEKKHAGTSLQTDQDYRRCIRCHNSHYQLKISGTGGNIDPSQPLETQCGVCHDPQQDLPPLSAKDKPCMACHRRWDPRDARAVFYSRILCLHCHAPDKKCGSLSGKKKPVPLNLSPDGFHPHDKISCIVCHPDAARFGHAGQKAADCRMCHSPHNEKSIRDSHLGISCETCHLKSVRPLRDAQSGIVKWARIKEGDLPSVIHNMAVEKSDLFCFKCHFQGNRLGASGMLLPSKSILCLPCHPATFSASDPITISSLILFGFGIAASFSYWLSGALPAEKTVATAKKSAGLAASFFQTIFSGRIFAIPKGLFLGGLLQLPLYRQSVVRWVIHGLIVWPLMLRFGWGMIALIGSQWFPEAWFPWVMLNKNHPSGAFLFDFTGLIIISGAATAIIRNMSKTFIRLPSLPKKDHFAAGLIGAVVFIGFLLEGIRIAMTGSPPGSGYAFIGYGLSRLFAGMDGLDSIYGYVWYLHAAITGIVVAYLPFSGMFHIILAPLVLAINAATKRSGPNHL